MSQTLKLKSILAIIFLAAAFSTRADVLSEKGRDIYDKNHAAVITVQLVQKATATAGRRGANEQKAELTGTVLDPSGLIVIALSAADPSELTKRMYEDAKVDVELTEIHFLLEDGTEVPAEIVLRDKDLDLAFLRPKTKLATPLSAIDFGKSGKAQVLDEVVTLNRLRRGAGRAYAASVERISAVVQKPRTFYIPDGGATQTALGSPAFTLDGNLLGILVTRAVNAMGSPNWQDCMTAIFIPADDIMKAAAQAPQVKPEEEKKEVPKDSKDSTTAPADKEPAK